MRPFERSEALFTSDRQREWSELDAIVRRASEVGSRALLAADVAKFPALYRNVCVDLARADGARYSAQLLAYLESLTASAHAMLYAPYARSRRSIGPARRFARGVFFSEFPRVVRRHRGVMAVSAALFFLPFVFALALSLGDANFAFRVVPEAMLRPLTEGYARGFGDGRALGDGAKMAGFYVDNNVGIALRCFALGVFGGLGSALYLVMNGLFTGAVVGYVASQGAGANIVAFVVGHGSLELGAIVLAGGAGLTMGWALVAPRDKSRIASLQACADDIVIIVFGASLMLLSAAAIEAFWSASSAPLALKRAAGAVMFVAVAAYLVFAGRHREPKRGAH